MQQPTAYYDDDIKTLDWMEHIRRRPGMYIGKVGDGSYADYGIYVEFGTGSKGDKSVSHTSKRHWTYYSGGRFYTTSGQAPQPFLVPALKNNISEINKKYREGYGVRYWFGNTGYFKANRRCKCMFCISR